MGIILLLSTNKIVSKPVFAQTYSEIKLMYIRQNKISIRKNIRNLNKHSHIENKTANIHIYIYTQRKKL